MKNLLRTAFAITGIALIMLGCKSRQESVADYPIHPVPFTSVKLTDNFWTPRIKKIASLPIASGKFAVNPDSSAIQEDIYTEATEIFRLIEGASYSLQTFPDIEQGRFIDTLISKILTRASAGDYLTYRDEIILQHDTEQRKEQSYDPGYLFEAAAAHYQATGKRTLLDIAIKSAEIDSTDESTLQSSSGIGLIKLYRVTGEKRYLHQALLSSRYMPRLYETLVKDLYSNALLADIGALTGDSSLIDEADEFWDLLVSDRLQITGSVSEGAADICESIADIYLNQRLFLWHGQSKYYDIIEKVLYNSILPGISLSGDSFSCFNPSETDSIHQRIPWSGRPLCRSDLARMITSLPGYVYAVREKEIFVNLFISNEAMIQVGKRKVSIVQKENLPWEGKVGISVNPDDPVKFTLRIRIPGWALDEEIPGGRYKSGNKIDQPVKLAVNGINTEIIGERGYAVITRKWIAGDKIEIEFPMPVRKVSAIEKGSRDTGKIAFQRGPVIYCAEWPDNQSGNIFNLAVNNSAHVSSEFMPKLLGGTSVIRTSGFHTKRSLKGNIESLPEEPITLIPYALWNNRGSWPMKILLPVSPENTRPLPAPTIAFRSRISGSNISDDTSALNDQIFPVSSNDPYVMHYDWWPVKGQWVWVQYDFDKPHRISQAKVYWLDDGPGGNFRVPIEWEMLYLNENVWTPVHTWSGYQIAKDSWNTVFFNPVIVSSVKIKTRLKKGFSGGMYEWIIE